MKRIITITREYGSGGRLIAQETAKKLGIVYYDNEIIDLAAMELGIDLNVVRKLAHEKTSSFAYTLSSGPYQMPLNDQVFATQSRIIKEIATADETCIIVNGCANYILEDMDNVFRIFIYAPLDSRIQRVNEVYKEEHKDTKKYVLSRDKKRKEYYNYYTTYNWGDNENYDLLINSDIGVDEVANIIANIYEDGNIWKKK